VYTPVLAAAPGTLVAGAWTVAGPRFAYVANNTTFGTVSAYRLSTVNGALIPAVSGSPFAAGTNPVSVTVSPDGAFAYVANNDSAGTVSAYTIDPATGALTDVTGSSCGSGLPSNCFATGSNPLSVTVSPNGAFAYVANYGSGNVSAYTINATTGALAAIGTAVAAGTNPYSVTVSPDGRFAYVANNSSNNVSAYTIDATTGVLTAVGAVAAGTGPISVTVSPATAAAMSRPTASIPPPAHLL